MRGRHGVERASRTAGPKPGDVVVAQGTGGVSLCAVQLAKAHGATGGRSRRRPTRSSRSAGRSAPTTSSTTRADARLARGGARAHRRPRRRPRRSTSAGRARSAARCSAPAWAAPVADRRRRSAASRRRPRSPCRHRHDAATSASSASPSAACVDHTDLCRGRRRRRPPSTLAGVCFDFAGTLFSDRALRDVHLRQLRFVAERGRGGGDRRRSSVPPTGAGMGAAYRAVAGRAATRTATLFADGLRGDGGRPRWHHRAAPSRGGRRPPVPGDHRVRPCCGTTPAATLDALRDRGAPRPDRVEHRRRAARSRWSTASGCAGSSTPSPARRKPARASPTAASIGSRCARPGASRRRALFVGDSARATTSPGPAARRDAHGAGWPSTPSRRGCRRRPPGPRDPRRSPRCSTSSVERPLSEPSDDAACRERFLDGRLGEPVADHGRRRWPAAGRARCSRSTAGRDRWVLRRAPRHASSSTAHDVLREFRILDAIKDEPVRIARPILACDDPDVFGSPFYVMAAHRRRAVRETASPTAWAARARDARPRPRAADRRARRDPRRRLAGRAASATMAPHRRLPRSARSTAGCASSPPTAAATCRRRTASATGSTPTARPTRRRRCATATTSWTTCCSRRRTARPAGRRRLGDGVDR